MEKENLSTSEWWSQRRFKYNIGLIIAGVLAFIAHAAIVFSFKARIPDAEITVSTTMFQAVGYLIVIGIANICYFLGPLSERMLKPKNLTNYQHITFKIFYTQRSFWITEGWPKDRPL